MLPRRLLRKRPSSAGAGWSRRPFVRATRSTAVVATQPCVVCGRTPAQTHHIRFAQLRALGRKVSDEYTVPVCRVHHRELHDYGDEASWWAAGNVDPMPIALDPMATLAAASVPGRIGFSAIFQRES